MGSGIDTGCLPAPPKGHCTAGEGQEARLVPTASFSGLQTHLLPHCFVQCKKKKTQSNEGWMCVYANTFSRSVYAWSRASAMGRLIRGQHRNSIIPRSLFHPYKGKGWRTGGRRGEKSVPTKGMQEGQPRALGSSPCAASWLPAASVQPHSLPSPLSRKSPSVAFLSSTASHFQQIKAANLVNESRSASMSRGDGGSPRVRVRKVTHSQWVLWTWLKANHSR